MKRIFMLSLIVLAYACHSNNPPSNEPKKEMEMEKDQSMPQQGGCCEAPKIK
ncbi:MAG: hypothetical protein KGR16_07300 [Verrucomicrobia bacterium]|nr:hypothetical protein [Verrucomicrobiota bacterium]